uniref:Uncharacterized protein n=1 Tax=Schistosoma haematobium TaxID=6185 RepID=A0A094ZUC2_SCHHA
MIVVLMPKLEIPSTNCKYEERKLKKIFFGRKKGVENLLRTKEEEEEEENVNRYMEEKE